MKFTIVLIFTFAATSALAQEGLSKLVSRQTVETSVKVSASTVRCSSLGYGRPELKIDVPALDWAASFNHRTFGEGQPCMTSVTCSNEVGTDLLLSQGEAEVPVRLIVTHTEKAWLDRASDKCSRYLEEHVEMQLRGLRFTHVRTGNLAESSVAACEALLQ